ncbi:lysine N(6)-hydroxylase/L-ornithine N(5)-oxygenase family protein [Streptomyces caniscabiei]|uniref:L-lysine N6-monooxygenase MbtG n=1 Tax=Streptomyces caniscabiei TaxID=2746961 RepID=A0A927QFL1_9ACTN|nr:lysine N(6)-hydroxylase/L-ornithine N(5)-oxygenase family protein [Streptomyces caniscabiei]MBD9725188.1 lysine N(6)-hydroxylase/L-ornithine N(5)-oxygenase family protein [Streptomyces caniscabiei]MDX3510738.1 lysine N(6)-hydroxylase/L-ornithine N(5)-oxygenase family protein [Streptomyces caniscabiei]MDX3720319.1 lysine N(6)-hydroxylase/L-ornithine N(5)-oxygenase family protein [Streptomyces caniscabiei]MDX3729484.1 lysine N(6)-hydroxylase/L-ornithine N(5)-oxygenase family protein [Streptomy
MTTLHTGADSIYDVLGIGFGPSNLALAIALHEHSVASGTEDGLRVGFLERQPRFGWHRGMLIDDATMQVSFLKDLVTMRDPTSDFSFLCYLRDRGRLVDFLNLKTLFPLRIEFHDYFEWAAARVAHLVEYSSEVVSVRPVTRDGEIRYFDVTSRTPGDPDSLTVRRTRSICVATGLEPHLPPGAALSERVWHNSQLLPRVDQVVRSGQPVRRAVVLGAGQSAAEAVDYLHRSFPEAEICSVFAKYGYTPADDSPFANKIFDPEAVDLYYGAPREVKQSLFDYHRSTNYSVVDMDLIESLSRSMYQEKVQGRERLRMMNVSRLREVETDTEDVKVTVEFLPTGEREILSADLLVYATGYRPQGVGDNLGEIGKLCLRDDEDALMVGRDHRVTTNPNVTADIYLQGGTEHTHGLTSTLLSTTAVRAGEICASLLARRATAVTARG